MFEKVAEALASEFKFGRVSECVRVLGWGKVTTFIPDCIWTAYRWIVLRTAVNSCFCWSCIAFQ